MKYITLIIGLLVVGCLKKEQADTNESTPTTTEKPAKELTPEQKQKALRDSAVGTYEGKKVGGTLVFLDNGVLEAYNRDGEKRKEGIEAKWKVIDGEIHADNNTRGDMAVLSINKDGSLTIIAKIRDGKRTDIPKESQKTFKKIKSKPVANNNATKLVADDNATKPVKELTAEEKKVVGTYEREGGRGGWKLVLLNTGVFEVYSDGKKEEEAKWKITKEGEMHVENEDGDISIGRINKDGNITWIASIDIAGEREDLPKEDQVTFKKIK